MVSLLDLVKFGLSLLGLLALSFLASYALARLSARRRKSTVPHEGCTLRIKVGADLYRARFLGVTEDGWSFTPPMTAGSAVPLRVGQDLRVEALLPQGVMRFATTLTRRSLEPFLMVMAAPENARVEERRDSRRLRDLEGTTVLVEGKAAKLVDVAEGGLRVREGGAIYKGECVRVDAPWCEEPMFGYVLEVLPPGLRSECPETRIRVSDPLDLDRIRSFAASLL